MRLQTPSRNQTPNRIPNNKHQPGSSSQSGRSHHSGLKHRPTSNVSKIPQRNDGYLREFTFVDENGRPKTVMAWVPHDN